MTDVNLSDWKRWFLKYVQPVFISEGRDDYYTKLKELQAPFYPKFWIAEKFYNTIKNDERFDEELKLFFSFLYSCGFFMENIITFEQWLNMTNWENPASTNSKSESIIEILKRVDGLNELKTKCRWIVFVNRKEGF